MCSLQLEDICLTRDKVVFIIAGYVYSLLPVDLVYHRSQSHFISGQAFHHSCKLILIYLNYLISLLLDSNMLLLLFACRHHGLFFSGDLLMHNLNFIAVQDIVIIWFAIYHFDH